MKPLSFDVVTLFPEMFQALKDFGITSRAFHEAFVELTLWNPRDFTSDIHRTVDDRPYGGGPGMLMIIEPLKKAIEAAKKAQMNKGIQDVRVIHLSPRGLPLTHQKVMELSRASGLIFLASRYEGVDERLIESSIDEEISIIIEKEYQRAITILEENKDKLLQLADILIEKEVIFKDDLETIFGERKFNTAQQEEIV